MTQVHHTTATPVLPTSNFKIRARGFAPEYEGPAAPLVGVRTPTIHPAFYPIQQATGPQTSRNTQAQSDQ